MLKTAFKGFLCVFVVNSFCLLAQNLTSNQTDDLSLVVQNSFSPFQIKIERADFVLPNGLQAYARGVYKGKWLLLAGRTNGMHTFNPNNNNFPPSAQNTKVYVVDPSTGKVHSRSLKDPSSGLTQQQIDSLSVTSPQDYFKGRTLYMTGGYGVDTATGQFSTKDLLTAIDIPGLMSWVISPFPGQTAAQYIRQISSPIFQVTGGEMFQIGKHPTLLIFGQNFSGFYHSDSNGEYVKQVRRFHIHDNGSDLSVKIITSKPCTQHAAYRRRDLNVVPVIKHRNGHYKPSFIVYGGVFTPDTGVWTVPVEISRRGNPKMANPYHDTTFKQAMNHYDCASFGIFSKSAKAMHTTLCGGISYGFIENGQFQVDSEIPFINQVTTITVDKFGHYAQYLTGSFPTIKSVNTNPGNTLLFGAGARFFLAESVPAFKNGVIDLDAMGSAQFVIGYIVGGIQSTVPNTETAADSAASPYIFKVTIIPK